MNTNPTYPEIIQGGMGVNISNWETAKAVSKLGQRGTVSGVYIEGVIAELLRRGDQGNHIRRALETFPFPDVTERVLKNFLNKNRSVPPWTINPPRTLIELTICANYANVWLAKEGHAGEISVNNLTEIWMPLIYGITGVMLAGADFITMGAGIPLQIPGVIDSILEEKLVTYRGPVEGETIKGHTMEFSPETFFGRKLPKMNRPGFIPIISSNLLASIFVKKLSEGSVQGFVIEEPTAGGHNAPPRKGDFYGEKDLVDYPKIAELGFPFWIAGSYASPEKLAWAKSVGAKGVQLGSLFALCDESGMRPDLKEKIRKDAFEGNLKVTTDFLASPTGYPFKVAELDGTMSQEGVYTDRIRICDKCALRHLYETPDGKIGYRCPSEPEETWKAKGGDPNEIKGRKCLCNGLLATAGLNDDEIPIVTIGDEASSEKTGFLKKVMKHPYDSYGVKDAIDYMLSEPD